MTSRPGGDNRSSWASSQSCLSTDSDLDSPVAAPATHDQRDGQRHEQRVNLRNWYKLPVELQVSILSRLPSLYLRPLSRSEDPYWIEFFQRNTKNLCDVMAKRNVERLRKCSDYEGKPFFQCFQKWFSEKGSDAPFAIQRQTPAHMGEIRHVWDNNESLRAFRYEYGHQNSLLGFQTMGDLPSLGEGLSRLHVAHVLIHRLLHFGNDGKHITDAQKEMGALCETIRGLSDFPEVAAIDPGDEFCELIYSDKKLLGEVRWSAETRSDKRLLTRLSIPAIERCFSRAVVDQPSIPNARWGSVTQNGEYQQRLFSISDLPWLPSRQFAYYVKGAEREEEIAVFLARTQGDSRLQGLDHVRFLELISVM